MCNLMPHMPKQSSVSQKKKKMFRLLVILFDIKLCAQTDIFKRICKIIKQLFKGHIADIMSILPFFVVSF